MNTRQRIRRIFISSPLRDLDEYRQAAKRAIGRFQQIYDDFTEWSAEGGSPLEVSLKRVKSSDLLLMILAHRYGTEVEELAGKSITHAELEVAIKEKIPVRGFFVDKDYPWVVQDIDSDPRKLENLKKQSEKVCTPAYFRSPMSLEIEVSRCLLEILISEGLQPEAQIARLVRPRGLAELSASSQDHFVIGTAPDSLPIVLQTRQDHSILKKLRQNISSLLASCQTGNPDQMANEIIDGATTVARAKARQRFEYDLESISQEIDPRRLFVIQGTIPVKNVFAGILDSLVTKQVEDTRTGVVDPETTVLVERIDTGRKSEEPDGDRYSIQKGRAGLGVGISGEMYILVWKNGVWKPKREYILESLSAMKAVTYALRLSPDSLERTYVLALSETLSKQGAVIHVYGAPIQLGELRRNYEIIVGNLNRDRGGVHLIFDDVNAYQQGLKGTDLHLDSSSLHVYSAVPLSSIVDIVLDAGEEISKQPSLVHGNIKPSNILITSSGCRLVDGWNLSVGKPTPYFSDSWAPPEQAMGEGLDESADVYALCKTLVALLRLQMSGELRTYRVPKWDSSGDHNFEFISDPYIQYRQNPEMASFSGRHRLREVLRRGLAGRREERLSTVRELLAELREIPFSELTQKRRISISPSLHSHQLRLENGQYTAFRWFDQAIELDPEVGERRRRRPDRDLLDETIMLKRPFSE